MAYSALTQPHDYMAGYSAVPLRVNSDNSSGDNFKYLINITYSGATVTGANAVGYGNLTYTELQFGAAHGFNIGDTLLLDDSTGLYSDFYNVLSVTDTTAVADFIIGAAMTGTVEAFRVIAYKMSPDPDGEAKLDLSNTLKDFVTQNLEDTVQIYEAPNSRFDYSLHLGEEQSFTYDFDDNIFVGGNVGFVYTAGTQSYIDDTLPFEIGDSIIVQQDVVEWPYVDNFFNNGELAFSGTAVHNFRSGQTVTVTGQITQPYYNGIVGVREAISSTALSTWKTFTTSTPPESGIITGVPVPEYNTTTIITDIYYSAGTGVVIATELGFAVSTQPIPGNIKLTNDRTFSSYDEVVLTGLTVYNGRIKTADYGFTTDQFDKYVCQFRSSSANNISTMLGNTYRHRIEAETKSWLLGHNDYDVAPISPRFTFYDVNDNVLSQMKYEAAISYGPQVDIGSYSNNGGNLNINCSQPHNLSPGDTLEIFQAPAAILGITTVLSTPSANACTVDISYSGISPLGADYIKEVISLNEWDDFYFPIGINQLTANTNSVVQAGSALSSVVGSVDYYKVQFERLGSVATNEIYFELNKDCSRYEIYHLMWKDRLGSWLSYPFKYISMDSTEIERKNYYKTEGRWDLDDNTFGYDTYGRGEQSFFVRSRDSYVFNSGWVDEEENELMKDLAQSASVYIQKPDGTMVGAMIKDKKIKLPKKQSDYLWNFKFEVVESRNEIRL